MKRPDDTAGIAVALVTAAGLCVLTLHFLVIALTQGDAFVGFAALMTFFMAASAPRLAMTALRDPGVELVYFNLKPGLYRVHWVEGGTSLAAIGLLDDGTPWMAPINWTGKTCAGVAAVVTHNRVRSLEVIPDPRAEDGKPDLSSQDSIPDLPTEDSVFGPIHEPVGEHFVMYCINPKEGPSWFESMKRVYQYYGFRDPKDLASRPFAWTVGVRVWLDDVRNERMQCHQALVTHADYRANPLDPILAAGVRLVRSHNLRVTGADFDSERRLIQFDLEEWVKSPAPAETRRVLTVTKVESWPWNANEALVKLYSGYALDYPRLDRPEAFAADDSAWTVWVQVVPQTVHEVDFEVGPIGPTQVVEEDVEADLLHPVRGAVRRLIGQEPFEFIGVHYAMDRKILFVAARKEQG